MKDQTINFGTKVIHVGGEPDPTTGAIIPPIYQTSTYVQESPGKHQGYEYTRSHNPTRDRLEACLASLENAKYALTTASGMSAVVLIMQTLPPGSTIICGDDVYGGTYRLFQTIFHSLHKFIYADTTNLEEVEKILTENKAQYIWLESPTNPLLKITDIQKTTDLAKKFKAQTIVDNTFLSPYFQTPLDLGADVVVHSLTKYINGHSDMVGGSIMLNDEEYYNKLWYAQNSMGPSSSPFDSWLCLRGVKTLSVRMDRHEKNAQKVANFLEKHPQVESVTYPGLTSHPQHAIAKEQWKGFGGMVTFFIQNGLNAAQKFLESLKLFALAESLGGVESLANHPAIMTHASIPDPVKKSLGITDNLVRLSVGIEDADDLIADLEQAFEKCK